MILPLMYMAYLIDFEIRQPSVGSTTINEVSLFKSKILPLAESTTK